MEKSIRGIVFTLTGAVLWGLSGSNSEYLMSNYSLPPAWLSTTRMLASGILLLLMVGVADRRRLTRIWRDKRDVRDLLVFSLFGMIANQLSYLYAISNTNAGTATVLQYMAPVLILIFVCLRKRRYPTHRELIAIVLTLFGIFIITTHGNPANLVISPAGLFWGISAAVTLSVYNILPVRIIARRGAMLVTGYAMIIGGLAEGLVFRVWTVPVHLDGKGIGAFAFVVLIGTVVSYTLYLKGVQMIGPVKASMLASVEPVSATVFTVLMLGTQFTAADVMGFVMIIGTVFILGTAKTQGAKERL